jgi:6-hydroxycyclohex-1-ene-1-carbonyl-CoA dehydrogenase
VRAAIFDGGGKPLRLAEVPTPCPEEGEVLVRVAACGICHTDLHYLDHGTPTFKTPPLILGHECSGTVVASDGAGAPQPGTRVLVPAVLTCGACRTCRDGRGNICERMGMLGNHRDGAFAEYVTVPAKDVVPLPEGISLEDAALVADAVSTAYHAVRHRAWVGPGDTVAVFGCGGVGLNVVQCAVLAGGTVVAVDTHPDRLQIAREMGASDVVDASLIEKPEKEVKRLTGGGVDVAVEAVGKPRTLSSAMDSLRRGGRLVVLGFCGEGVTWAASKIMFHELQVIGSLGCRPGDLPLLLDLVKRGRLKVRPLISGKVSLEEINTGLDRLRRGEGVRWLVIP